MPRTIPSYTIANLTASDFSQVVFRPYVDMTDPLNPVNTLQASGYYTVKGSDPNVEPDQKFESVSVTLSPAQKTAFVNFMNANIVPAANAQEGL